MGSPSRGWLAATGALALLVLTAACGVSTVGQAAGAGPSASASSSARVGDPSSAVHPGSASAAAAAGPVVALGDSYTAGALLPLSPHEAPPGCLRSTKAYPVLVTQALGAPLTDAACASAGVKNMTEAQQTYLGTNPAQLSVLRPDDSLVLMTLGGDDMGFLNVLKECVELSFTRPSGSPCQAHYTQGGTDQLAAGVTAEGPKIAQALAEIAASAPKARIVVVGYPDLFPQAGGCWPAVPITDGDIAYLRGIEVKANAVLAAEARAAGDTFVDTYTPTTGHDFCTPESVRDVEGLLPGSLALPFHPNARGQQVIADAVLGALKGA
ncbi:MAG TPA: SGNH/GDSL hydrolase family protein [Trebonia sp.]